MKKLLAMTLMCAMTAALLTGCGASEADVDAAAAEVSQAVEDAGVTEDDVAAAATEAASEIEAAVDEATGDAAEGSVLVAGTNAEFPPFEYVGDDGEPDGFDMALIKAIGEKMGMEVQIENMEFASLVSSIGSKIDVAIAGMTVTDERKETVDFSDPYYEAVQFVLVPADSEIKAAADLEGKTIGVQLGTTGDFLTEDIKDCTPNQYNKAVDAVNDLVNGRVDAVIIDKNPALVFEQKFEGKVVAIDGADFGFEPEEYAIAMPKGDTELAGKINAALKEMKEDGSFDALVAEYIEQN